MEKKRTRNWADIIVASIFVIILFVPGLATIIMHKNSSSASGPEIAHLAGSAPWLIDHYDTFKTTFEKTFAGRMALVDIHAHIKKDWLDVSPSERVAYGRHGWLFYTAESEILCSRHAQFSQKQLASWTRTLEARQRIVEKMGASYLFIVAPDKHSVMTGELPEIMRPVKRLSRLDQLVDYLRKHSNVHFVDLRPALAQSKKRGLVYYKTDTHWNPSGAYTAYEAIVANLASRPIIQPRPLSDYTIENSTLNGDLASFINLKQSVPEKTGELVSKHGRIQFHAKDGRPISSSPRLATDLMRSHNDKASVPKLVLFRDSFGTALLPFFAQDYRDGLYLWSKFDASVVREQHPSVVIDEIVERYLMCPPPALP